jgi:hypothetical protein
LSGGAGITGTLPIAERLHAAREVSVIVVKVMSAVIARGFADIVKVIGWGRIKSGFDGADAGRGDGAGR